MYASGLIRQLKRPALPDKGLKIVLKRPRVTRRAIAENHKVNSHALHFEVLVRQKYSSYSVEALLVIDPDK
jgi:hypothetical protein